MRFFAVGLVTMAVLSSLGGCGPSYLGRMITLRGPDVEDHARLPGRAVPVAPQPARALPEALDPEWPRRRPIAWNGRTLDTGEALGAFLREQHTTAFVLLHRGRVVDERYFQGYDRARLCKSFSMSKSVLSALVGIAAADGLLEVTDPVATHLPDTAGSAIGAITLAQLLDNVSGFHYERGNAPWKQQPRMYYTTDVRGYVRSARVDRPPGSRFQNDDLSPLLLGMVLEAALRTRNPTATISDYAAKRLWQPMGAQLPARWVIDREPDGIEKTESGLVASAIDLARFGQLYLDGGKADGTQVVPAAWVAESVSRPPAGSLTLFKEGFHRNLWWGYFRAGRQRDDFYANGHFGQRIYVSPDREVVVVRLGSDSGSVDWTTFLAATADAWGEHARP
jgi:CubicO group peptidase (beta-lactamase class C family)